MDELETMLPENAFSAKRSTLDTAVSRDLYALTERLSETCPDKVAHGLLGGEFGYGADYQNDTFMMHHYCWCEKEDCPWCAPCECEITHTIDGKDVSYEEWDRFFEERVGRYTDKTHEEWMRLAEEVNSHRSEYVSKQCDNCKNGLPLPNFKVEDFEVRWYKYIGRSMEFNKVISLKEWHAIFDSCIASIKRRE